MNKKDIKELSDDITQRRINDRQSLQRRETEDYLKHLCVDEYPVRQGKYWKRDYSSTEKYLSSVEPNRKRWLETLGDFSKGASEDFELEEEPFLEDEDMVAKWVSIKLFDKLRGRAILGLPKKSTRLPLIVCQHGYSCSPEAAFGFADKTNSYDAYAYKLVKEGFAMLAPLNITTGEPRNRCERIAHLLGKSLFGLEIFKIRRFIDYVSTLKEVDENRIGMWGLSMGGTYTLFTLPAELRIKAGIISAFFNHRIKKMAVEDPRYSCYLPHPEYEQMFLPGWLREFTDSDLVSLICPRPLMIQTGKADGVSWWPFVLEEFKNSKRHYEKLKVEEKIEMYLHNAGHEIRFKEGLNFLKRWL